MAEKRVTIKEVAKEAGVSAATISYVLNNKESISEDTKRRVHKVVEKLGYVPNLGARALVSNATKLIGVIIPQTEPGSHGVFNNLFYSEIIGSIEFYLRKYGYNILISATEPDKNYFELVKQRNLDGVIAIGIYPKTFYKEVRKLDIPIILVDSYFESRIFHEVGIDDHYGEYLATEYLIKHGHRKIAFFSGSIVENGVVAHRYQGYLDALNKYDIPLNEEMVFEGQTSFESGLETAQRFISQKSQATAIVCTADVIAIGAIKYFQENGVKIPEDVSIIGFDNLELCRYITPSLTTIGQNITKKGEKAAELLLHAMQDHTLTQQKHDIKIELVERNSVKTI